MRFEVNNREFIKKLNLAREVIASSTTGPILANVLLMTKDGKLFMRATDMRIHLEVEISDATVKKDGSLTVPCKKLLDILNVLNDSEVTFESSKDSDNIEITPAISGAKVSYNLKTIPASSFPEFVIPDNQGFKVNADTFSNMIDRTFFAASKDENRVFLNGIYMEKDSNGNLTLVATDGRRLSLISEKIDDLPDFEGVIIPSKTVRVIKNSIAFAEESEIFIFAEEKHISFKIGTTIISSSSVDGTFPDYRRVLKNDQDKIITLDRLSLSDAMKRVSVVSGINRKSKFEFEGNSLKISSGDSETASGDNEMDCEKKGDDIIVSLSINYVSDVLNAIREKEIAIYISSPEQGIKVMPSPHQNDLHIIMPMQ